MKTPTLIASFESATPAGLVARKLRYAGFDARVRGEIHLEPGIAGVYGQNGVYRVLVPATQAVRALSWCREFDAADALLAEAIRCPQCGSTRAKLGPGTAPTAAVARHNFHCDSCQFEWTASAIEKPAAA